MRHLKLLKLESAEWTQGYFYCANKLELNMVIGLIFVPDMPQEI